MRIAIGIGLFVVGVVLLIMGMNESDSFASDVSRFFTGNPTDRSVWMTIAGVGAIVAGAVAAFVPLKWKRS
ncbi:MAG TPA: DUF3185 family protein [Phycisphaerales bacterium]|jgi:hypothetical protein|nr:DUF3185 family protein [Phycisphaerales bacterium]